MLVRMPETPNTLSYRTYVHNTEHKFGMQGEAGKLFPRGSAPQH